MTSFFFSRALMKPRSIKVLLCDDDPLMNNRGHVSLSLTAKGLLPKLSPPQPNEAGASAHQE